MYAAYFENSAEGERNAESPVKIIVTLVENKEKLFEFVRENGESIKWD